MELSKYKLSCPNTYLKCAKWLHKTLDKKEYAAFSTLHMYAQGMFLLQFLSLQGFNVIDNLDGYSKLGINISPLKAITETIDKGFLKLETNDN